MQPLNEGNFQQNWANISSAHSGAEIHVNSVSDPVEAKQLKKTVTSLKSEAIMWVASFLWGQLTEVHATGLDLSTWNISLGLNDLLYIQH